jgi:hypothetical protein
MMQKIGFDHRWVKWIMTCVTSVRYAVKFNGAILDSFAPSRGLRQGDPLSPFLFLFIADGLSALLRQGIQQQVVTPVKICARAPGVSHLLFADDTLLFFKATNQEATRVKEILENYGKATEQLINHSKCSTMFSTGCSEITQQGIRDILQVQKPEFEAKYLGLPTPEGRLNKGKLQNLQVKFTKRFMEWGDGLPSQAAKEVLIKAVAQSIPTYIMGVFKLPLGLCDDLNRMVCNYWWGSKQGARKTHWKSWDALTHPKKSWWPRV